MRLISFGRSLGAIGVSRPSPPEVPMAEPPRLRFAPLLPALVVVWGAGLFAGVWVAPLLGIRLHLAGWRAFLPPLFLAAVTLRAVLSVRRAIRHLERETAS